MKNILKSAKIKHGSISTIFTAIFIAIVILINVCVSALTAKFPSLDMDLTQDQIHSLSEDALEVAESVTTDIVINIIGDKDDYTTDTVYYSYMSQGYDFSSSQVATLAEKLAEASPYITVRYIDPDLNPEFISAYPNDVVSSGKVLISSDARYKLLDITDFYTVTSDSTTGETLTYSTIDGAYANAIYIVNLEEVPVIAIPTGHDEMFTSDYRATFDTLVEDNGFIVVEFDILTEDVPEDAQVIFLPTPSTDYSEEEIAKIRDFLSVQEDNRVLMVSSYPGQTELPNLEELLEEWGIEIGEGIVLESDLTVAFSSPATTFIVNVNEELFEDATSYTRVVSSQASPIELLFNGNNDTTTYALTTTNDTAYVIDENETVLPEDPETDTYITSAVSKRLNNTDSGVTYTSVYVTDTVSLLSSVLGTSSYSNRQMLVDFLQTLTGVSDASVGLYIPQVETNVSDITATVGTIRNVGLYTFTIIVPILILVAGLVIFLRRRHL